MYTDVGKADAGYDRYDDSEVGAGVGEKRRGGGAIFASALSVLSTGPEEIAPDDNLEGELANEVEFWRMENSSPAVHHHEGVFSLPFDTCDDGRRSPSQSTHTGASTSKGWESPMSSEASCRSQATMVGPASCCESSLEAAATGQSLSTPATLGATSLDGSESIDADRQSLDGSDSSDADWQQPAVAATGGLATWGAEAAGTRGATTEPRPPRVDDGGWEFDDGASSSDESSFAGFLENSRPPSLEDFWVSVPQRTAWGQDVSPDAGPYF
jgi:hypothetical protein